MILKLENEPRHASQPNSPSRLRGRVGVGDLKRSRELNSVMCFSPTRRTLARERAGECVDLPRKRER